MLTPFVIALRECLEMFIFLVPLMIYAAKVQRRDLEKYILIGGVSAIILSICLGFLTYLGLDKLSGNAETIFNGGIMLFLAGLVLYNIILINSNKKSIEKNVENNYESLMSASSMFFISFITIFRESLEIIMFNLPNVNTKPMAIIVSTLGAFIIAFIVSLIIFKFAKNLNIYYIFLGLTFILIFIGMNMFAGGITTLIPSVGKNSSLALKLVYAIPLIYLIIKKQLKNL